MTTILPDNFEPNNTPPADPTRDQLRAAGGGAGIGFNELVGFGLTPTEAATRTLGFQGVFGIDPATGKGGAARTFRTDNLTAQQTQAFSDSNFNRAILLGANQGTGLTFNQLTQGGLTDQEATNRLLGFTGTFGDGRGGTFRDNSEELQAIKEEEGINDAQAGLRLLGFTGDFGDSLAVTSFKQNLANTVGQAIDFTGAQPTTVAGDIPITDVLAGNALNPELPAGGELVPTLQTAQGEELLTGGPQLDPVTGQVIPPTAATPTTIPTAQGTATAVDENEALAVLSANAPQVTPNLTTGVAPGVAPELTVSPESTVGFQLAQLTDFSGGVPDHFRGAISKAEEVLAARGLGSSTIAGQAIAQAVIDRALPIASQDAATYFQADLAQFSADQTFELQNLQNRQQNMLTDTAIANAAEQFNAANQTQVEQFTSTLIANIQSQNANRTDSMSQFNTSQANSIAAANAGNLIDINKFNAQMNSNIAQFNSTLQNDRDKFNSTMAFAVDQSNALWRRTLNTQSTATINAANAINTQNRYNISATAQSNLWQQFRDESAWAFASAETDIARAFNAVMAATNRDFNADLAAGAGTAELIFKFLDFFNDD